MKPEHYERKRQFLVTLPPTVARWLQIYGDNNLSTGILELVRHVTDVDAFYPDYLKQAHPRRTTLLGHDPHENRKKDADTVANWSGNRPSSTATGGPSIETEADRFERIKQNTLTAARAQSAAREELRQQEDAKRLEGIENDAFAKSETAFGEGKPLPDHAALNHGDLRAVRARVLERCRLEFGWEHGPKPPPPPPPQWQPGEPTPGMPPLTDAELAAGRAEEEAYLAEQARLRQAAKHPSTVPHPGPITEEEAAEIAALEEEVRGDDQQGYAAHETAGPVHETTEAAHTTEPAAPLHGSPESSVQEESVASTAAQDTATDADTIVPDPFGEPTF